MEKKVYEITIRVPGGNDVWWRAEHDDFHDATLSGIAKTMKIGHVAYRGRLIRIEQVPEIGKWGEPSRLT
jgi:hypothetical protein